MKKPNIKIKELKCNRLEMKIGDDITIHCKKWAEAQFIEEMIGVLMDAYEAIDSLPDDALGKVRPSDRFEEYPVKYELIHNIRKALKKAGVQL